MEENNMTNNKAQGEQIVSTTNAEQSQVGNEKPQFEQSQMGNGQMQFVQPQFDQAQQVYNQQQFGQQMGNGQQQFGQPQYGQYGQQPQMGYVQQPQFGQSQPQFGQSQPQFGQSQYGQYGQQAQFGQPQFEQNPYLQGFPQQGYWQQPPQPVQPGQKKGLSKKAKIGIFGGIGALVVAAVLLIFVFKIFGGSKGANTAEEAAEEFLRAWAACDADKMIDYSLPDDLQAAAEKYVTSSEFQNRYGDIKSLKDAYKRCYALSAKADIHSIETEVKKTYDQDYIKESENYIKRNYDVDIKIEAIKRIRISVVCSFDGGKEMEDSAKVDVYQVDGRWYVFPEEVLD